MSALHQPQSLKKLYIKKLWLEEAPLEENIQLSEENKPETSNKCTLIESWLSRREKKPRRESSMWKMTLIENSIYSIHYNEI